jgi:hypothetical protein
MTLSNKSFDLSTGSRFLVTWLYTIIFRVSSLCQVNLIIRSFVFDPSEECNHLLGVSFLRLFVGEDVL